MNKGLLMIMFALAAAPNFAQNAGTTTAAGSAPTPAPPGGQKATPSIAGSRTPAQGAPSRSTTGSASQLPSDTTTAAGSRIGTSILPEDSAARARDLNRRLESPAAQGLTNSVLTTTNAIGNGVTNGIGTGTNQLRNRIVPPAPVFTPPAPAISPAPPAIVPGVGTFGSETPR